MSALFANIGAFIAFAQLSVNPALREVLVIAGQSSRIRGIVFDEAHHMGDPQSCGKLIQSGDCSTKHRLQVKPFV